MNKGGDEELLYGTRVNSLSFIFISLLLIINTQIPQVVNFDDTVQVNGHFVMELKKKWPCATHLGEHGKSGHCYITPNGEHFCLNPLHLKMWVAAMVSSHSVRLFFDAQQST